MKKTIQYTLMLMGLALLFFSSCEKESKDFDEYVFGVQLVDDQVKIQEYLDYHTRVWPEVETGFKNAGYEIIRLYRFENYVSMIVQVPKGANLEKMGKNEALNTARVKEWNALMATYQKGLPGVKEGSTWVAMDKIYQFENKN